MDSGHEIINILKDKIARVETDAVVIARENIYPIVDAIDNVISHAIASLSSVIIKSIEKELPNYKELINNAITCGLGSPLSSHLLENEIKSNIVTLLKDKIIEAIKCVTVPDNVIGNIRDSITSLSKIQSPITGKSTHAIALVLLPLIADKISDAIVLSFTHAISDAIALSIVSGIGYGSRRDILSAITGEISFAINGLLSKSTASNVASGPFLPKI
jgi:hypothetical protein